MWSSKDFPWHLNNLTLRKSHVCVISSWDLTFNSTHILLICLPHFVVIFCPPHRNTQHTYLRIDIIRRSWAAKRKKYPSRASWHSLLSSSSLSSLYAVWMISLFAQCVDSDYGCGQIMMVFWAIEGGEGRRVKYSVKSSQIFIVFVIELKTSEKCECGFPNWKYIMKHFHHSETDSVEN